MAVVKANELNRDNMNLEMQKLQKQFGANEAQQSNDMNRMRAEFIQQQQAMQTGLKTDSVDVGRTEADRGHAGISQKREQHP